MAFRASFSCTCRGRQKSNAFVQQYWEELETIAFIEDLIFYDNEIRNNQSSDENIKRPY